MFKVIFVVLYFGNINIKFHFDLAHVTGKYEGRIFDDRDVIFDIGEVSETEVISGIQHAIQQFGKGETSR